MAREEERVELAGEFDALLRSEMAVVPSTAFLPRVRARMADDEVVSPFRFWWMVVVPVAAVAVLILVPVAWLQVPVATPAAPDAPVIQVGAPVAPLAGDPVAPAPVQVTTVRHFAATPVPDAAVVIVDERRRAGLAALIGMTQEGRITKEAFAQPAAAPLQPITDTVVPIAAPPVQVSPIVEGGVLPSEK